MRVDILLQNRKFYTFEAYASEKTSECFKKLGIDHQKIYLSDGILQDYLFHIQTSSPHSILSFSNPFIHNKKPFCDVIQVPHFYWVQDSLAPAISYLNSSFGKIGLSDKTLCGQLSHAQVFHLPFGVKPMTCIEEKQFDVAVFANLVELNFLTQMWQEIFVETEVTTIRRAVEQQAPLKAKSHYYYVEQYLKAQKDYEKITSINGIRLDVFGLHIGNNWLTRLPNKEWVYLHSELPYGEHFEVLKLSKIALIDPTSHWYRPAIACGCLPLSPSQEEVSYYLSHPKERKKRVEELKHEISNQSWENQTERLLEYLA